MNTEFAGYLAHTEGRVIAQVGNIRQERATIVVARDIGLCALNQIVVMNPDAIRRMEVISLDGVAVREGIIAGLPITTDMQKDIAWLEERWKQFETDALALVLTPIHAPRIIEQSISACVDNVVGTSSDAYYLAHAEKLAHVSPRVMREQFTAIAVILSRIFGCQVRISPMLYRMDTIVAEKPEQLYSHMTMIGRMAARIARSNNSPVLERMTLEDTQIEAAYRFLSSVVKPSSTEVTLSEIELSSVIPAILELEKVYNYELTFAAHYDLSMQLADLLSLIRGLRVIEKGFSRIFSPKRMAIARTISYQSRTGNYSIAGELSYRAVRYAMSKGGELDLGQFTAPLIIPNGLSTEKYPVTELEAEIPFKYTGPVDRSAVCIRSFMMCDTYEDPSLQNFVTDAFEHMMTTIQHHLSPKAYRMHIKDGERMVGSDSQMTVLKEFNLKLRDAAGGLWDDPTSVIVLPVCAIHSNTGAQLVLSGLVNTFNVKVLSKTDDVIQTSALVDQKIIGQLTVTSGETLQTVSTPWSIL